MLLLCGLLTALAAAAQGDFRHKLDDSAFVASRRFKSIRVSQKDLRNYSPKNHTKRWQFLEAYAFGPDGRVQAYRDTQGRQQPFSLPQAYKTTKELDSLGRLDGVLGATLYGEGGQVSAQTGAALPEAFAMYARFLVTAANVGGAHVAQGDLRHITLTYGAAPVLLAAHGNGQLAVVLENAGAVAAAEGWLASRHN